VGHEANLVLIAVALGRAPGHERARPARTLGLRLTDRFPCTAGPPAGGRIPAVLVDGDGRPDLRQLRCFLVVADTGQITEAARRLRIAQPTLSQTLTQLEAQIGVPLLERQPRGVRLTAAGRVFLERARAAVEAVDAAGDLAHELGRAGRGVLAVGHQKVPLTRWAPMFQRLCERRPGVEVRWRPLDFPRVDRSPVDAVDVAMALQPSADPKLSALVLERTPRVALMAVGHRLAGRRKLSVADILDEPFAGGDPALDPRWRAFWTLDEERGGPARSTPDRVANGADVVAAGEAIATSTPAIAASLAHPGIVAVPLVDARPVHVALLWRTGHGKPLVDELVGIAEGMREDGSRPRTEPSA
jgi:DNA-binding transcriptional LysR family regulator